MHRLTRDKVLQLVGRNRIDDHAVAEILRTGATDTQLVEALSRVTRGGEVGAEKMRPISVPVQTLCDILTTAMVDLSDPD